MRSKLKGYSFIIIDVVIFIISYFLAFYLRFEGDMNEVLFWVRPVVSLLIPVIFLKIVVFIWFKMYKSMWKYASIDELVQIVATVVIANAAVLSFMYIIGRRLPRSIYGISLMIDMILIGGSRLGFRVFTKFKNVNLLSMSNDFKNIMIIGAGSAGSTIIKELKEHQELKMRPVAAIDDNMDKIGKSVNGVPVVGTREDIKVAADKYNIDEIIISIPSASRREIRSIIEECKKTNCKLKTLPGIYEIIDGKVDITSIREVKIEDLLGREEIDIDINSISGYLENKTVLVTGGGGSIGSELCRQISAFNPSKLLIFDIYENSAYELIQELKRKGLKMENLKVLIGSIRDEKRVEEIFEKYRPNVVFHAAAHKHVPLMENNPKEAFKNNVFGTLNMVKYADAYSAEKFVLISTDKAVNPTNIMGATKRICEMIVQAYHKKSLTEFAAVRFGNVLGSNGSVIPLFKKQIEEGGPITVTHKDVIRYFMTIPEATRLVIQAGAYSKGGEIFVLDMGEPVKIYELAKDLIKLSGFEPESDIKIEVVGLRPGEKLYEELLLDEEGINNTKHKKIFVGNPIDFDSNNLFTELNNCRLKIDDFSDDEIIDKLQELVPTYKREIEKI